jgi:ABC-type spermidine/putrescine transport system permease subunit II
LGHIVGSLPVSEQDQFDAHLRGCAPCRAHLAKMEDAAALSCQELVELVTNYLEDRMLPAERERFEVLLLLPMVTPEIIMGISLLIFFSQLFEQNGSLGQIAIAHITFCISYVAIVVRARARGMDPHLEEAARDLGASPSGAFWHVTLPLIAPAVGAGAMLAFALSFDDLVITSFNSGVGSTTLPIFIYSSIKFGVTPQINAISTIIVAVVAIALLIGWRLGTFRTDDSRRIDDAEVEGATA